MVLAAFYIIISRYYRIHGNKCPFSLLNYSINLPYSVSCFLNVSFIHSTILDCLSAFQVINLKEISIINKSFCFKINTS